MDKDLKCACAKGKSKTEAQDELTTSLVQELYRALIAPVEEQLVGAEELLLVSHKELFEVPWAALMDGKESYLIERYVLREAPSLRVARQVADAVEDAARWQVGQGYAVQGHVRQEPMPPRACRGGMSAGACRHRRQSAAHPKAFPNRHTKTFCSCARATP